RRRSRYVIPEFRRVERIQSYDLGEYLLASIQPLPRCDYLVDRVSRRRTYGFIDPLRFVGRRSDPPKGWSGDQAVPFNSVEQVPRYAVVIGLNACQKEFAKVIG